MSWSYTGNTELTVSIDVNRVATITIPTCQLERFSESITFTATDPGLLADSDPATFTVSARPTTLLIVSDIPDQTVAEGSSFATISLDNYVTDIDNFDSEISWTYSGNSELTVSIDVNRIATITIPSIVNWNGSELITFTATDPSLAFQLRCRRLYRYGHQRRACSVSDIPEPDGCPRESVSPPSTLTVTSPTLTT